MAKLIANTVVVDESGASVSLLKGATVPAWATKQVGDHLLNESEATPYSEQKMADLKKEVDRRNATRAQEDYINPEGRASVASYAAALEADDKAQADSSDDGGDDSGSGDTGSGDGSGGSSS
jgi:hypothetical protein